MYVHIRSWPLQVACTCTCIWGERRYRLSVRVNEKMASTGCLYVYKSRRSLKVPRTCASGHGQYSLSVHVHWNMASTNCLFVYKFVSLRDHENMDTKNCLYIYIKRSKEVPCTRTFEYDQLRPSPRVHKVKTGCLYIYMRRSHCKLSVRIPKKLATTGNLYVSWISQLCI